MVDNFVFFLVVCLHAFLCVCLCAPAFVFLCLILPVIICLPTITPCMSQYKLLCGGCSFFDGQHLHGQLWHLRANT